MLPLLRPVVLRILKSAFGLDYSLFSSGCLEIDYGLLLPWFWILSCRWSSSVGGGLTCGLPSSSSLWSTADLWFIRVRGVFVCGLVTLVTTQSVITLCERYSRTNETVGEWTGKDLIYANVLVCSIPWENECLYTRLTFTLLFLTSFFLSFPFCLPFISG